MNDSIDTDRLREFDREVLRGAFVSLFWGVISDRRKHGGFTLQSLADELGIDKSTVSRWFSGDPPNWELNTVSGIGNALDLDIRVQAVDRTSGQVYTPAGVHSRSPAEPSEAPSSTATSGRKTGTAGRRTA